MMLDAGAEFWEAEEFFNPQVFISGRAISFPLTVTTNI
jgi:hypothetical protein